MSLNITAKKFDLTPAIRAYVEEKINPLFRHFERITLIDVELDRITQHHNKGEVYHARMNVQIPQHLIHADEVHSDMYAAIDLVAAEADRQLREQKQKYEGRIRQTRRSRRSLKSMLGLGSKDE